MLSLKYKINVVNEIIKYEYNLKNRIIYFYQVTILESLTTNRYYQNIFNFFILQLENKKVNFCQSVVNYCTHSLHRYVQNLYKK